MGMFHPALSPYADFEITYKKMMKNLDQIMNYLNVYCNNIGANFCSTSERKDFLKQYYDLQEFKGHSDKQFFD